MCHDLILFKVAKDALDVQVTLETNVSAPTPIPMQI